MQGIYLPGATWKPLPYRAAAGVAFNSPPIGWVLHVQAGNGSPYGYFSRLTSPDRVFSHAWVAKDGRGEQYTELSSKSWAQAGGNATYWSIESEGFPAEELTAAQISTLATWHRFLGVPDILANHPGEHGIGTHSMGGAGWGSHACPGPTRAAQRVAIIEAAQGRPVHPPVVTPAARPAPPKAPPFPLPAGWYFGPATGPKQCVSGRYSNAADLARWQRRMADRGWTIIADGLYGQQTAAVAGKFQRQCGLHLDYLIGRATWVAAWVAPVT